MIEHSSMIVSGSDSIDDVTYVYDDVTYVYDDVTYVYDDVIVPGSDSIA